MAKLRDRAWYGVRQYTSLIRNVRRDFGDAKIPKWQRGYVWGKTQREELVDSICTGIPIGQVLIWDNGRRQYILDGQQRILSLYHLTNPNVPDSMGEFFDVGGVPVPFWLLVGAGGFPELSKWMKAQELDPDSEQMSKIYARLDLVSAASVGVNVIEGSEQYAQQVFERMNRTGVALDFGQAFERGQMQSVARAAKALV